MDKPTILIIDDKKINLDIVVGLLGTTYNVTVALNATKAFQIVEKKAIDLILLDILMPDIDGFGICNLLKSKVDTKDIPIIFITAKTDEDSIEKAYEIGGIDYVTKPFKPKELLAKIKRELKLQTLQKELTLLASTDPMTKLYNRRYFSKISEHIFDLAQRNNQKTSVIMIDIDKFKNINDTYGHKVGDNVIINLANKLISNQRKSDVICRFGGEEFVILLPNTPLQGAKNVALKIKNDVENSKVTTDTNQTVKYTISLGLSQINIEDTRGIESALTRADNALYEAKISGRNRVCTQ